MRSVVERNVSGDSTHICAHCESTQQSDRMPWKKICGHTLWYSSTLRDRRRVGVFVLTFDSRSLMVTGYISKDEPHAELEVKSGLCLRSGADIAMRFCVRFA
jgi:hypothetical protein